MIRLDNVSRTYGKGPSAVHAVRELTLEIEAGTFVAIVGASGSGKSSVLNMMGGLDTPSTGQVWIAGAELASLSDRERTLLRRDKVGFVFQFFNLLPTLTAVENVELPASLAGRSGKDTRKRSEALLERVGLAGRRGHKPDEMSGGEMQRVAIARALMMDPPLLLADEPTGNLDTDTGEGIVELLLGAAETHRTVVLVTHDNELAQRGTRVLTMSDGRLVNDQPGAQAVRAESSV
jgi:ABC-type lipoprotein export system ATPase subunit